MNRFKLLTNESSFLFIIGKCYVIIRTLILAKSSVELSPIHGTLQFLLWCMKLNQ